MSIIDSADLSSEPLIRPEHFYKHQNGLPDTCVVTFSGSVYKKAVRENGCLETGKAIISGGAVKIWLLEKPGVLFYLSPVGAAAAGAVMHDVHAITGARRFIVFGSCGVLDPVYSGRFLIPTEAYRDEGLSYHYLPPEDFITIKTAGRTELFFRQAGADFAAGKVWTTDAVYMETRNKIRRRREEGCICVDMECAGLQAVSDYLGIDLYVFFFAGDILGEQWDPGDLTTGREPRRQADALSMAFRLAETFNQERSSNKLA